MSWGEVGREVRAISLGLVELGLDLEDRCAILSGTRVEWILADIGILCAGGAASTIYPTNTADECAYIIADSESRVVFAENQGQVDKLLEERANIPSVEKVVVIEGQGSPDGWVITLDALKTLGQAVHDANGALRNGHDLFRATTSPR